MKKIIRIVSIAVCVVMLGVMLCSCTYLDDKKYNRAVFCDDSQTSMTFRDYTYRKIKLPNNLSFLANQYNFSTAVVTDSDVPVLLADKFGHYFSYPIKEEHPIVISCNAQYGDFVREDQYEAVSGKITNAKMDHYAVYDYASLDEYSMEYHPEMTLKTVSDDTAKAINEILKSGKKVKYTELTKGRIYMINLIQCDQDMLVTNQCCVNLMNDGQKYYLLQTVNDVAFDDNVVEVPEKDSVMLSELFTQYQGATFPAAIDDYFYYGTASGSNSSISQTTKAI